MERCLARDRCRRFASAAALLAAWASPAPTPAQPLSDAFSERLRVVEVEVPVQVLVDGHPVLGLQSSDFRVLDRGEPREIVGFEIVDLSRESASEPEDAAIPDGDAAPPEIASRSLLVIFDFVNNQGGYLARAVDAVRQMVATQMGPADRVAVLGLGKRGSAAIVTGFTADRVRLGHALDYVRALSDRRVKVQRQALQELMASAPRSRSEQSAAYGEAAVEAFGKGLDGVLLSPTAGIDNSFVNQVAPTVGGGRAGASGVEEAFALGSSMASYQRYRDTTLFAEALGNLGTLLRDVGGQKHALLLSQGPPVDTLVTAPSLGVRDGGAGVASAFAHMTEQLARSGWVIHTLGQGLGFNDSLFYIATETGGTAFENINRLEVATAALMEQTSVTYVLRVLASDVVPDGRRHELEVELLQPRAGADLRYRHAYFAPRPPDQLSDVERRIESAERRLREASGVLEAAVEGFTVPGPHGARLLLAVSVRGDRLAELAADGRLDLEVAAATQPASGDEIAYNVGLDLDTVGPLPRDGVTFIGDLDLAPDVRRAQVLVRAGNRQLARAIAVDVGDAAGLRALPPQLVVSSGERLVVRESKGDGSMAWPLRLGGRELIPWVEPEVVKGQPVGAALWLVGRLPQRVAEPVVLLELQGEPIDADGVVSLQEAEHGDDSLLYVATLDSGKLEAGLYRLEVLWPGLEHPPLLGQLRVVRGRGGR